MRRVGSLEELRAALRKRHRGLVLEVYPAGCLLRGGQPLTLCTDLREVLRRRESKPSEPAKAVRRASPQVYGL